MIFLRCSSEFAMFCFAVAKMNLGSGMEISAGLYKTDFCKSLRSKTSSVEHDRCFHTFCKRTEFWNRNSFFATKGSEMSVERHLDKFNSCENLSIALASKFARTWCASLRTRPLRAIVAWSDTGLSPLFPQAKNNRCFQRNSRLFPADRRSAFCSFELGGDYQPLSCEKCRFIIA